MVRSLRPQNQGSLMALGFRACSVSFAASGLRGLAEARRLGWCLGGSRASVL